MKVIKNRFNQKVQNEFSLLLKINHENILRYFEHFEDVYDDLDCTFIITEYCQVSSNIFSKFQIHKTFIIN
mgnify:CR=1 FL=1